MRKIILMSGLFLLFLLSGCTPVTNPELKNAYFNRVYSLPDKMFVYHACLAPKTSPLHMSSKPPSPSQGSTLAMIPSGTKFKLVEYSVQPFSKSINIRIRVLEGQFYGRIFRVDAVESLPNELHFNKKILE